MLNKGLFSSKSDNWETPQALFDKLNKEFAFDIDVCASSANAKCKEYYSVKENGLGKEWKGTCWMNPPYGREISKWVEKAYYAGELGAVVVCLLPARTDTKWFHDYCLKARDIRFIRGRLHFSNSKNGAPFPSMIVIFGNKLKRCRK